jgi:ATP-dependent DNA helicase RecQ
LKINSIAYNGGLDPASRQAIEAGLINNSYKCVVSTNALGMGIDKPDIRFIIHVQTPQSPIHYYQEIGRAGRDNKPSKIILFYNPTEDLNLPKAFIEGGRPSLSKYQKVINALKENRLGERQLIKVTNLKQNQLRVIKADLIEQGIINEVVEGRNKKYEFKFGAPNLNPQSFEELRQAKFKDLDEMIKYINLETCRMKFLCEYLGDTHEKNCMICDNDTKKLLTVNLTEDWTNKLEEYRNTYFPILEVAAGALVDGVASSYYGVSNVGQALHRSKYENGGDFPDFLLKLTLKAFRKHFGQEKFDLVVYVPPTISGSLVKNFAEKIARVLNFPISHQLQKTRQTQPQKEFQNGWLKTDNVQGAFTYQTSNDLIGKSILLIDDIFDSGHTIKEIGKILSNFGAVKIAPLVIAKTIGSDI